MEYDKHINEFADIAKEYCEWTENEPNKEDDIFYLQTLLSKLHCWAIQLPDCEITEDHFPEEAPELKHQNVIKFYSSIPFQYYSSVFNAEKVPSEEPVTGDLLDDLTDIYKDLKEGLWHFERGEIVEAVFLWQSSYGFHWARHILSAMYALYCLEPS